MATYKKVNCPVCLKNHKAKHWISKSGILKGSGMVKMYCSKDCENFIEKVVIISDLLEEHKKLLKKSRRKLKDFWKIE